MSLAREAVNSDPFARKVRSCSGYFCAPSITYPCVIKVKYLP